MVETSKIRAVLFAKDLNRVANFYIEALRMQCGQPTVGLC
jgi:hypothetical protein